MSVKRCFFALSLLRTPRGEEFFNFFYLWSLFSLVTLLRFSFQMYGWYSSAGGETFEGKKCQNKIIYFLSLPTPLRISIKFQMNYDVAVV